MHTFSKTLLASSLLAAGTLVGTTTRAEDLSGGFDLSMNVTLASQYVWRGISQGQGKGAIQGGLDLVHESGFYAGTWASSVDFDSDTSAEWDFYAGYRTEFDPVALDVGLLQYTYVDENSLNFLEAYASVGAFGLTLGYHHQIAEETASGETADYIYLGYDLELPNELGLSFIVAQYDFKDPTFVSSSGSTSNKYMHYGVTVSKSLFDVDWALSYSTTDLSSSECESFAVKDRFCNDIVVVSVSKSL